MSIARLARFTLEIISREDLWDAVLDGWDVIETRPLGGLKCPPRCTGSRSL